MTGPFFLNAFKILNRNTFIVNTGTNFIEGFEAFLKNHWQKDCSDLVSLRDISKIIALHMGLDKSDFPSDDKLLDTIEYFLKTGDFEEKSVKPVCVNPTLLTLDDNLWEVS